MPCNIIPPSARSRSRLATCLVSILMVFLGESVLRRELEVLHPAASSESLNRHNLSNLDNDSCPSTSRMLWKATRQETAVQESHTSSSTPQTRLKKLSPVLHDNLGHFLRVHQSPQATPTRMSRTSLALMTCRPQRQLRPDSAIVHLPLYNVSNKSAQSAGLKVRRRYRGRPDGYSSSSYRTSVVVTLSSYLVGGDRVGLPIRRL